MGSWWWRRPRPRRGSWKEKMGVTIQVIIPTIEMVVRARFELAAA
jgi:hypothetical protein